MFANLSTVRKYFFLKNTASEDEPVQLQHAAKIKLSRLSLSSVTCTSKGITGTVFKLLRKVNDVYQYMYNTRNIILEEKYCYHIVMFSTAHSVRTWLQRQN